MDIYNNLFQAFQPKLLHISGEFKDLETAFRRTNLLVCGEVHGVVENADIIYTLCRQLHIKCLAIESGLAVEPFLDSAIANSPNFNLIDVELLDAGVLSIEMSKTVALLVQEGTITNLTFIDTYFDGSIEDDDASPQQREEDLANSILNLELAWPTLCLMGQWHTKTRPIQLKDEKGKSTSQDNRLHYSALYRVRQKLPEAVLLRNFYRDGHFYNDGHIGSFKLSENLPNYYKIVRLSDKDFQLIVPQAHKISIS